MIRKEEKQVLKGIFLLVNIVIAIFSYSYIVSAQAAEGAAEATAELNAEEIVKLKEQLANKPSNVVQPTANNGIEWLIP